MKLRYVRNLYWYDGPLSDLYIDEDFGLYISYIFEHDQKKLVYIVRKYDPEIVKMKPGIGVDWPKDFWDMKPEDDVWLINHVNVHYKKDYGTILQVLEVDVHLLTEEEKEEMRKSND